MEKRKMESLDSEGGRLEMEVKLICIVCQKELLNDVQKTRDDITLRIYPCSRCRKADYEKGRQEGVAEYLNQEGED